MMGLDRRTIATLLAGMVLMLGGLGLVEMFRAPAPAIAQLPDSGYQRQVMIRELQAINARLEKMTKLLAEIRDLHAQQPKGAKPARQPRP